MSDGSAKLQPGRKIAQCEELDSSCLISKKRTKDLRSDIKFI